MTKVTGAFCDQAKALKNCLNV